MGDAQEVEAVYAPTTVKTGLYKVRVTRKAQDLYHVDGSKLAVRTRSCYEYSYADDAILDVTSTAGFTVGTMTFKGP